MSQLAEPINENLIEQRNYFSENDILYVLKEFNEKCKECGNSECLVIILGNDISTKNIFTSALLGKNTNEDTNEKCDKIKETSCGSNIGSGSRTESQIPEAFKLTNSLTLFNTKGFSGANADVMRDILSTLILETYRRKTKKELILYLSLYVNFCNLTRSYEDMQFANQLSEDMDLPILFIANKCEESLIYKPEFKSEKDENKIVKIEEALHKQFTKMSNTQMNELALKFFIQKKNSKFTSFSEEETIKTLQEKTRAETESEKEDIAKGMNEINGLIVMKKALDDNRMFYYDPNISFSVNRIKLMLNDTKYYVSPRRIPFGRFTPESYDFLNSVSEMAKKLYCLVGAMKGRQQFTTDLKEVLMACDHFIFASRDLHKKKLEDMRAMNFIMNKMNACSNNAQNLSIEEEEERIEKNQMKKEFYEKEIDELNTNEPVKYDTINFLKNDDVHSNKVIIEMPIKIPNTTFKFVPANEFTSWDDEEQEPGIVGNVFRGAFKAPSSPKEEDDKDDTTFSVFVQRVYQTNSSVCAGHVDLYAPKRDIPSNKKKILEWMANVKELDEQIAKSKANISFMQESKEKEKDMMDNIKFMKEEEETWMIKRSILTESMAFCEECDKQWKLNQEMIDQLYLFAKCYLSTELISQFKEEEDDDDEKEKKSEEKNEGDDNKVEEKEKVEKNEGDDNLVKKEEKEKNEGDSIESSTASSSTSASASSSSTASDSVPSAFREPENERAKEENLFELHSKARLEENKKNLAKFAAAKEDMEKVCKDTNEIALMSYGEYDQKLVSEAVKEINSMWNRISKSYEYLKRFKNF
ncbi:uncharacterized protein MONOS_10335 [Monocercomonoides exilis]|uniref:uncharacterized protein n=1 Tax=Monocercomonoides exilis TaxID=2049356 RepID=UPI003559BE5D|nr:hypothetical protein MONOS_10335 [Monocercomonoides exilis]|eukprot:MONOS_10335.1-p1 / transcript=MONOS_10335.1 / gene=MONOS_10335 / organism=Monocercomonoides_exilis_PA203 / gene_product=unspecified product / transcript_product=unspecified product / location=Mono_scaffold00465:37808-40243(-) / protein_length=812 / sequence_SO=supercontig / SO=protein_coding / is_pseudo=false